jgi:hypothetical protein
MKDLTYDTDNFIPTLTSVGNRKIRIWVFIAYYNDGYGDSPFFTKLFDNHNELKAFSSKHADYCKDKVQDYSSTYFDLTDTKIPYKLTLLQ